MAIRASINYRLIKASVSHRNLNLTASTKKASAVIYDKKVYASISSSTLNASIFTQSLTAIANFRNLSLHDVHVNAERTIFFFTSDFSFAETQQISATKNIVEPVGLLSSDPVFNAGKVISDALNLNDFTRTSLGKAVSDSVSFSEGQIFSSIKAVSDSIAFSESVSTLLTFIRGFASFTTMVESVSFDSGKNAVSQFNCADEITIHPSLGKADSVSFIDTHASEVGKLNLDPIPLVDGVVIARQPFNFVFTETLGVVTVTGEPTDSFGFTSDAPIFAIETTLQDFFALDDFAQVDKDVSGVKTNVIGFFETLGLGVDKTIPSQYITLTEAQLFALSKPLEDSIIVSESAAFHTSKSLSDNTSFTDVVTLSSWIGKSDGIGIVDSIDIVHVVSTAVLSQSLLGNMILNAE